MPPAPDPSAPESSGPDTGVPDASGGIRLPHRRVVALWVALAVLLLLATLAAIGSLQREVYSASGVVKAYLGALAQHDVDRALSLPGVQVSAATLTRDGLPAHVSRELLRGDVLTDLQHVRIVGDTQAGDGSHHVTASYTVGGVRAATVFTLRKSGTILGVFTTWRFARTPLAVARITVKHAPTFQLAGHTLDTRAATGATRGFNHTADYLVFAPGNYTLGHTSRYLTARAVHLPVTAAARLAPATVTAVPNGRFDTQVQQQLDEFLDACTEQQVLQPTGCPFGIEIDDQVEGVPTWRMTAYPPVTVVPGPDGWQLPSTGAVAHLTVRVRSLFDGHVSTTDADEPFTVSLPSITIEQNGSLTLTVGQ